MKNILVIGGTRFFGRHLVNQLLGRGHKVTIATRGQTPDTFGDRVQRIKVNRRDREAMIKAFANTDYFDLIYDQMCYNLLDIDIANDVFDGNVGRYIMSSTIETYNHLMGLQSNPYKENDFNLSAVDVEQTFPWHEASYMQSRYADGKRQAEAHLYNTSILPAVTVRIGHVIAGREDFTKRLQSYVLAAIEGTSIPTSPAPQPSSFITVRDIVAFLIWLGEQNFIGPINAACEPALALDDILKSVQEICQKPIKTHLSSNAQSQRTPYDYLSPHVMDTGRAKDLGFKFSPILESLPRLVQELLDDLVVEA
ncbi:NAD-dependent epimerase/dehydratase family protein [Kiloniella antarctica]|uniref:UDP-glucose 4-epimerase n=1 Tax=Kiloniella antarctica TaxID=1550907 RepID=A0ABW5BKT4_9PROT